MTTSGPHRSFRLGASAAFLATEFVIIVLGVLAALAVDEWRGSVERRELRDQLISGLIADLEADEEDYEQFAVLSSRRSAFAHALLEIDPSSPAATLPDGNATTQALRSLGLTSNLETADITFAEMTANGTGLAIEDTGLRLRISHYYALARDRSDINEFNIARTSRYMNALEDMGMSPMNPGGIDAAQLLADPRIRAMIETLGGVTEYASRNGRQMLEANQLLLNELRSLKDGENES